MNGFFYCRAFQLTVEGPQFKKGPGGGVKPEKQTKVTGSGLRFTPHIL